jgi:hypothetical protein
MRSQTEHKVFAVELTVNLLATETIRENPDYNKCEMFIDSQSSIKALLKLRKKSEQSKQQYTQQHRRTAKEKTYNNNHHLDPCAHRYRRELGSRQNSESSSKTKQPGESTCSSQISKKYNKQNSTRDK